MLFGRFFAYSFIDDGTALVFRPPVIYNFLFPAFTCAINLSRFSFDGSSPLSSMLFFTFEYNITACPLLKAVTTQVMTV